MKKHRIDIAPSQEDITSVLTKSAEIADALSFLLSLNEDERKRLARLGLRNETFALGAIELARRNPQAVPNGIDMAALERDIAAREMLLPILRNFQRITKLLEDTVVLLGCDIYEGGRALYKTMKVIGDLYGLGDALAELGRRFENQGVRKAKPDSSTPEEPAA